ncbi:MAG TPA: AraC family transcriptional regulator, partial [Flavobacteriaceae bacterium]|nr:AraC family transcriptional regulator [Flavobacteriaceae bacterium]
EEKNTTTVIKTILNQIVNQQLTEALQPVFIKGKIYELLSYYFSTITEENSDHCPYIPSEDIAGKVKLAKEIIVENLTNPPSLEQLAKQVGLNIKKLKTEFKEYYGVPVFTFLLNYKMEQAKNLLKESQMNVNEIATYLGYSTSSHFIAAFKKKYGITPKQYAKQ